MTSDPKETRGTALLRGTVAFQDLTARAMAVPAAKVRFHTNRAEHPGGG